MNQNPKYPLLPFSQYIYDMVRWFPFVYRFTRTLRWKGGAKEEKKVREAILKVAQVHPVFRTRIDWQGRQYEDTTMNPLDSRFFNLEIFTKGDDLYLRGRLNVILADGMSIAILVKDFLRAYEGEELKLDNYWEYIAEYERIKLNKRYAESKEWLEKEFADVSVPVRPTIDRHLTTLLPPKVGLYKADYSAIKANIQQFAEIKILPIDGVFSLCTALAIAEYCGTEEAALTWAHEGRDLEEQHICGCLHRDIPFMISRKSKADSQKQDLIRQARNQIRSGIAHSDYPYTLMAPYNKRWNYAVNVLRVPDEKSLMEKIPFPIEILPSSPQKYAYALLDVEIHEHTHDFSLWFRYSATHYKESSIRRFAAMVRKYVEWFLEE